MSADPPLNPGVKEITAVVVVEVALREVGALGVVAGITDAELEE